jgi:hypothetical protein
VNPLLSPDLVAVQVPDVVSSNAHVFALVETEPTLAAVGTTRVETLVSCLQYSSSDVLTAHLTLNSVHVVVASLTVGIFPSVHVLGSEELVAFRADEAEEVPVFVESYQRLATVD